MKRGLVSWDKRELPPAELAARLAAAHSVVNEYGVDALVLYSDVWRCNDARFISNYMPYWNRAFVVVSRGEAPILLCALSPRVYPWIKTVTVHETIIPSPSPAATLLKLAADRGWKRVGVCDLDGLPEDLHGELTSSPLELVDIPRSAIRQTPSDAEVRMHARAACMAREVLEKELNSEDAQSDHELTGRLERLLRRIGAEDVVVLVSDGNGPPVPASGAAIGPHTSVVVAVEYNGHWAKVTRNVAGITTSAAVGDEMAELRESLSGPYSWEHVDAVTPAVISLQREIRVQNRHLYYGDTCLQVKEGLRVL